jgi:hypothetical protein
MARNDTPSFYIATATSPGAPHKFAPPEYPPTAYTLARLSKVDTDDVRTFFEHGWRQMEVPSVVPLGDGSYELIVLTSDCHTLRNRLNAVIPGSEIELDYNPVHPSEADVKIWGVEMATGLHKQWFLERAIGAIRDGWPSAAACYAHHLKLICGFDYSVGKPGGKGAGGQPLTPPPPF